MRSQGQRGRIPRVISETPGLWEEQRGSDWGTRSKGFIFPTRLTQTVEYISWASVLCLLAGHLSSALDYWCHCRPQTAWEGSEGCDALPTYAGLKLELSECRSAVDRCSDQSSPETAVQHISGLQDLLCRDANRISACQQFASHTELLFN